MLNQSYPYIQHIVMDGGSTRRESVEILKSYGDRIYWESKKDKGQADAINQGMSLARGQVLAYLNSDDVLPGAVSSGRCRIFNRISICDMVYGRAHEAISTRRARRPACTGPMASINFGRLMHDCCICQPAGVLAGAQSRSDRPLRCLAGTICDGISTTGCASTGPEGTSSTVMKCWLLRGSMRPRRLASHRGKFYDEIFAVCLKNGGYIDYNYYLGLWHHRMASRDSRLTASLGWIPGAHIPAAWLHYKSLHWREACEPSELTACMTLTRIAAAVGQAPLAGPWVAPSLRLIKAQLVRRGAGGFHADNWMEPSAHVVVQPKATGQRLRHIGVAPVDMKVTVKADDKVLGIYPLRAGQPQAIGTDISLEAS